MDVKHVIPPSGRPGVRLEEFKRSPEILPASEPEDGLGHAGGCAHKDRKQASGAVDFAEGLPTAVDTAPGVLRFCPHRPAVRTQHLHFRLAAHGNPFSLSICGRLRGWL